MWSDCIKGAFQVDTFDEFCGKCGVKFSFTFALGLSEAEQLVSLRKQVPRSVAVLKIEYCDDGRRFVDYYFVCCRQGILFAYQVY